PAARTIVVPFIYQTVSSPVAVLRQTRSGRPSPFISAAATSAQFVSGTVRNDALPITVSAESRYDTKLSPVVTLCQTRSGCPSPLTAAGSTSCHAGPRFDMTAGGLRWQAAAIVQTACHEGA